MPRGMNFAISEWVAFILIIKVNPKSLLLLLLKTQNNPKTASPCGLLANNQG